MTVRPNRQASLRGLQRAHVLAAVLGGVAALAAIAGFRPIAAAAALIVTILQLHSLEVLRSTLIADGEKRP